MTGFLFRLLFSSSVIDYETRIQALEARIGDLAAELTDVRNRLAASQSANLSDRGRIGDWMAIQAGYPCIFNELSPPSPPPSDAPPYVPPRRPRDIIAEKEKDFIAQRSKAMEAAREDYLTSLEEKNELDAKSDAAHGGRSAAAANHASGRASPTG